MKEHVVRQGECLSTIAHAYGLASWKRLWDESANDALRKKRKSPNVLYAGDVVKIPDLNLKEIPVATGKQHKFQVNLPRTRLKLQMKVNDEAIANEEFRLEVGAQTIEGKTDGGGLLDVTIPLDATKGTLVFPERGESYTLLLGHLNPVDQPTGAQARLRQLGFYAGAVDGEIGAFTQAALTRFQEREGLDPTGEMNSATEDALTKAYGC